MDWLVTLLKDATFWTALGALATVAATGAIVLAVRQLQFDAWLKAQEIWTDEDLTAARGRLFRLLRDANATWAAQDEADALLVCRRTDEFARLIPYFALTTSRGRKRVLSVWSDPLAKSWAVLEPFVRRERERTGWPSKWDAFEAVGKEAMRRSPRDQQTLMECASKRVEHMLAAAPTLPPAVPSKELSAQPASRGRGTEESQRNA